LAPASIAKMAKQDDVRQAILLTFGPSRVLDFGQ
jgi:hypothetical protein